MIIDILLGEHPEIVCTILVLLAPSEAQGITMSVCLCGTSLSKALNLHLSGSDLEADHSHSSHRAFSPPDIYLSDSTL